jgi:hypothetical protein
MQWGEGGNNLAINRLVALVVFSAAATALSLSTSAFAWPCPVDFIASIDDNDNGFSTMISKRHYRFVPPDESGLAPNSPNPKHLPVDTRSWWDDVPPWFALGERVAICNDRNVIFLDSSRSQPPNHTDHALIERVP